LELVHPARATPATTIAAVALRVVEGFMVMPFGGFG
jgi:hypothetical protein